MRFSRWLDIRVVRVVGLHPKSVGKVILVNGQRARVKKIHKDGFRIKVRYEP